MSEQHPQAHGRILQIRESLRQPAALQNAVHRFIDRSRRIPPAGSVGKPQYPLGARNRPANLLHHIVSDLPHIREKALFSK